MSTLGLSIEELKSCAKEYEDKLKEIRDKEQHMLNALSMLKVDIFLKKNGWSIGCILKLKDDQPYDLQYKKRMGKLVDVKCDELGNVSAFVLSCETKSGNEVLVSVGAYRSEEMERVKYPE